jgi:acetoacetyl-CoA synthetase
MNKCLWTPSEERINQSNLKSFISFLVKHYHYPENQFNYAPLHTWSLANKESFWKSIWEFLKVDGDMGNTILKNGQQMPGAQWFTEAQLNFAQNLLKETSSDGSFANNIAIVERGEHGRREEISFQELKDQVAKVRHYLIEQGVQKGDCVAGFLPNSHHAIVAMLATAAIGAIWTSCSPDFGIQGVLDRFQQTQPKVLFACDGYYYANKTIHTLDRVASICESLDKLSACVIVPYLNSQDQTALTYKELSDPELSDTGLSNKTLWTNLLNIETPKLTFEAMSFNSPLYVMYSSGTTGKPKCIMHTVGGTLLQHVKEHALHTDVKAGTNLFYYTTCGWMMWNWLVSGLSLGARIIVYDGSPFHPKNNQLFDLIDEEKISIFGVSAKYYAACEKFELTPSKSHKLDSLTTVLSTGSPLSHESFEYLYDQVKADICVSSISGGTDIISCFALGCPILPVYQGELQCIGLGMDVAFVNDHGQELKQGKGELVCRQSFPSMPSGFWNDADGTKYHEAYFSRFENTWAHGDYGEVIQHKNENNRVTQVGVMIHGRSDAVLNPGGVRIGTAEIYRQVEKVPSVFESIAIGQNWQDDVRIILFVRLQDGKVLDENLVNEIKNSIRSNTTPRHVPSKIIQVSDIPRTISGKIVEVAVKKIVEGLAINNTEALANPEALDLFKNIPALQED